MDNAEQHEKGGIGMHRNEVSIEATLEEMGRCILYVEDDETVSGAYTLMLKHLGYDVALATRCNEAISLLDSEKDRFDLVITDMDLPDMDATELSKRLHEIKPDIPIVLCTELNESVTAGIIKEAGIKWVIPKPCTMDEVAQVIWEVME